MKKTNRLSKSIEQGKATSIVERTLFASRWVLLFFYVGIMAGAALLAIKFSMEFWGLVVDFSDTPYEKVLLSVLAMVDMALIAHLLLMVSFVGYDHFISKLRTRNDYPIWLLSIDHNDLKLKMMGSIAAISAIKLLQVFLDLDTYAEKQYQLAWMVGIHLTIVCSGLLLSLSDRLAHKNHGISEGMSEAVSTTTDEELPNIRPE